MLYPIQPFVPRETVLKYSQYWSTASPQLHGPKAKPDSASKRKALRGVVATQTEPLEAGQSATSPSTRTVSLSTVKGIGL